MKYYLLAALLIFTLAPTLGFAEDCTAKFNAEQLKTYSTLSPASKQMLASGLKMRNGTPATCEFRAGMMDMLVNFPPEKRDAALNMLADKMLIRSK